jgi:hypothetical protein
LIYLGKKVNASSLIFLSKHFPAANVYSLKKTFFNSGFSVINSNDNYENFSTFSTEWPDINEKMSNFSIFSSFITWGDSFRIYEDNKQTS